MYSIANIILEIRREVATSQLSVACRKTFRGLQRASLEHQVGPVECDETVEGAAYYDVRRIAHLVTLSCTRSTRPKPPSAKRRCTLTLYEPIRSISGAACAAKDAIFVFRRGEVHDG